MKRKAATKKRPAKFVKGEAKCASFDIQISAEFFPRGLATAEIEDVRRKLKNSIAQMVARLPFAHVYPFEVKVS